MPKSRRGRKRALTMVRSADWGIASGSRKPRTFQSPLTAVGALGASLGEVCDSAPHLRDIVTVALVRVFRYNPAGNVDQPGEDLGAFLARVEDGMLDTLAAFRAIKNGRRKGKNNTNSLKKSGKTAMVWLTVEVLGGPDVPPSIDGGKVPGVSQLTIVLRGTP